MVMSSTNATAREVAALFIITTLFITNGVPLTLDVLNTQVVMTVAMMEVVMVTMIMTMDTRVSVRDSPSSTNDGDTNQAIAPDTATISIRVNATVMNVNTHPANLDA